MARKARQADLGRSMVSAVNGDGHAPVVEVGPQVAEPRISSPFPPIAEYAFLSDCEVNCLVAPSGQVELTLDCQPVFDYGATDAKWEYAGSGYNEAIASGGENEVPIKLVTDLRVGFEGPGAHATKTLRQGERAYVAMVWPRSRHSTGKEYWDEHPAPATVEEAFDRVEKTADFWREWINRGEFPEHPWQSYLQRSALTLKGLTYSPTGALLAAPTTSLPETIGGERNWDYRYTWIRDGTFMLWGLYTLGFAREANDFFYFIADVAAGKKDLQIMYGIGGEHELTESWQAVADEIKSDICEQGVDDRGVFVQHYGSKALDASVLLIPLVRFLPPDDPRVRATVLAIADELTVDGMVLRYRTEETDDGLRGEEGTFTICSFWLVSAPCR